MKRRCVVFIFGSFFFPNKGGKAMWMWTKSDDDETRSNKDFERGKSQKRKRSCLAHTHIGLPCTLRTKKKRENGKFIIKLYVNVADKARDGERTRAKKSRSKAALGESAQRLASGALDCENPNLDFSHRLVKRSLVSRKNLLRARSRTEPTRNFHFAACLVKGGQFFVFPSGSGPQSVSILPVKKSCVQLTKKKASFA